MPYSNPLYVPFGPVGGIETNYYRSYSNLRSRAFFKRFRRKKTFQTPKYRQAQQKTGADLQKPINSFNQYSTVGIKDTQSHSF